MGELSGRERVAGVVGAVLLGLAAVLAVVREWDEGAAYALGVGFGTVALPILLAALVRLLYVRVIRRRGDALAVPWLLLVAGGLAVVIALARVAGSDSDVERARDCREQVPTPFEALGRGLEYQSLTSAERRNLAAAMPPQARDLYEARRVVESGEVVGYVFAAALSDDRQGREDITQGFVEGAGAQGSDTRSDTVAGRPVTTTVLRGQHAVVGFRECYGIAVVSADLPSAKLIARPLLAEN